MNELLRALVRDIYARAKFDPAKPPGPVALTFALLGEYPCPMRFVQRSPKASRARGAFSVVSAFGWCIQVDDDMADEYFVMTVGRALAGWYAATVLRVAAYPLLDELGSRIVLPDETLLALVSEDHDADRIGLIMCLPVEEVLRRLGLLVSESLDPARRARTSKTVIDFGGEARRVRLQRAWKKGRRA